MTAVGNPDYPLRSFFSLSPDHRWLLYVSYDDTHLRSGQVLVAVPLAGGKPIYYSPWTNGFGDNYATFAWQPV